VIHFCGNNKVMRVVLSFALLVCEVAAPDLNWIHGDTLFSFLKDSFAYFHKLISRRHSIEK
jgi:hypothetical protein